MKSIFTLLLVMLLLPGAVLAQSTSFAGYVPDRVIVIVKEGVTLAPQKTAGAVQLGVPALDALSTRFDVSNVESLYGGMTAKLPNKANRDVLDRTFAVDFPAGQDLQRVKAAYESVPEVQEVWLVEMYRQAAFLPDDPSLGGQWYLRNMNPGGADVRAVGGWNQSLGDSNVVVAIIDSGMDWHHPDLGGTHPDKVNGAIYTDWVEYYGSPGVDDDGNGYVDDMRGWDFVASSQSLGWPDEDMTIADNDPSDYGGHGTAVGGCVGAITDNGIGIAGVAPGVKLLPLRAGYTPADSTSGILRSDWMSQAMVYSTGKNVDIINISAGSGSFLSFALTACQSADILVVTAAGNDDSQSSASSWLSTQPGVVSAAATDQNDARTTFSNYGSWVDVAAPGTSIYTTAYISSTGESTYASVDGTSFSSPIAAGVAAMILSANPGFTYFQVKAALEASCDNIDDVNPDYIGLLGHGRVNVLKALGDNMHRYPDEFPTLFDAMNSSAVDDTVGVLGGTAITGPLTIPDGGLKMFAGYNADYSSRDPLGDPAVITGNLADTVLRFLSGVDTDTELDGFVIQGGGGATISGIPYNGRFGGGVVINSVSPTLRNMLVTGNSVGNSGTLGGGGGILMNNSSAVLENVTVSGNTAIYGGAVYVNNSSPVLIGCTLENNTLIADNLTYKPKGGGLFAVDSDVTMTDCTVTGHLGCESGGGIYGEASSGAASLTMNGGLVSGNDANLRGAGIYHDTGALLLHGVTLDGNLKGAVPNFMSGGGVYASNCSAAADSLVCTGNTAQLGSGVTFENCSDAVLSNSLLHGNTADFYGALVVQGVPVATVTANTIADNAAPTAGAAGFYTATSSVGLSNNIIAFNTGGPTFANGVYVASGLVTPSCNDVFGHDVNYGGITDPTGTAGNISADPEFCDALAGEYDVKDTSPCHPDNSAGCGLIGALGDGCGILSVVGDPVGEDMVPMAFNVEQNFPNPFNPVTKIRFSLPESRHTEVAIFDIKGRRVRTIVSEPLAAESHEVVWRGQDDRGRTVAAGVYFYMVSSGEHRSVGRMALVK